MVAQRNVAFSRIPLRINRMQKSVSFLRFYVSFFNFILLIPRFKLMESNRQVRSREQLKRGSFINTSKKCLLIGFEFTSNKNAPPLELLAMMD